MRHRSFSLSLCLLLLLNAAPSFAAGSVPAAPAATPPPAATPIPPGPGNGPGYHPPPHPIQVVQDEKAGVVRILIDGKEVFAIDAKGLHVEGDVVYSGVTTDAGGSLKMP